nr:GNAT family N-acetyltransferase [Caldicoprobacter guelmensis]
MSVERRNDINKAIKDNLAVRKIDDYNIVKSLVLKTFSRQKKDVDNKYYLDKILFSFANDNNSFAFATFKEEIPIASAFCVYDRTTAYYLLGGYDHEFKHHGAGALAVWEAIKCSKELGLKYFDFEGSMIPQIERYFRGFGGELTAYFRINRAWLPLEVILKCYRRELF